MSILMSGRVQMVTELHRRTFRSGSRTYFNSSRFFPRAVRDDVFALYGFVRRADDYVDSIPQDSDGFVAFRERYERAARGNPADDPLIDSFVELSERKNFDPEWTKAFLHSLELDLTKQVHATIEESLTYIYGSAEVIGLFMAKILDLSNEASESARMLGRAMQFIIFIRDIAEDTRLGRTYLPISECPLKSLSESEVRESPEEFRIFVSNQLKRYSEWQERAEAGYRYLPHRYLVPIRTAGDMYKWTARKIAADPFVVFDRAVKPGRLRIVTRALKNMIQS